MSDINEEKQPDLTQNEPEKPVEETCRLQANITINGEMQRKLSARASKCLLTMLIIGSVFLLGYIVLSVMDGETIGGEVFEMDKLLLYALLIIGAILFGIGLIFTITVRMNIKTAEGTSKQYVYRFYEHYVLVESVRYGESLGTVKTYYSDFMKVCEWKNFFLLFPNSSTVFPVDKSALTPEEIETLRNLLPKKR